ncbi:DNA polymerase III subunit delta [Breoghania sp. L-A4]|uniref:DNA polymerase III subunit delta n=1 Tax=Breoghania sp. L-A4 TaxID=2304600 RepID=UPI000E3598F1|nr:DNA polymerase III subunit delta [Breoghania sp. L-A4]AXS38805.1 DNA polymerase III subunit delta [Breoghania sp. L-A4]
MVALKAAEIDRFVANPSQTVPVVLVYGPDTGLVAERAQIIVKAASKDNDDPFSLVKLDPSDLTSDPQRLIDEVLTVPLFGGKRIIWVRNAGGANLAPALEPVLKLGTADALVVIDAGDLKKTSGIRKLVEKHRTAVAIPCYADATRDLEKLIDEETRLSGLTITREARSALQSLLGADRMASRGEIRKLCLYALGKGRIEADDVEAVVGDASAFALDTLIDAAATGDLATLDHGLDRLDASGIHISVIATSVLRHFQWLHQARAEVDAGKTADFVVDRARPPVYFKRKTMMAQQIHIWSTDRIERALELLDDAAAKSRLMQTLGVAIVSDVLVTIARVARQARRR